MGTKAGCKGFVPDKHTGLLLWLLDGANGFVRFTLPIRKENLFHPCYGEVHRGIIFGELTYCCLLML